MQKLLFIGDSITDVGAHVALVNTYLKANPCLGAFHVDNIGLCSENTSGLTEAGHPGERPHIQDRIDRILDYYNSNIAIVMYGVNDAIYRPFSEERFTAFKNGVTKLVSKLKQSGMSVYLCTPTAFDARSCKTPLDTNTDETKFQVGHIYTGYNEVMGRYAEWIRAEMRTKVDKIIDMYSAMNTFLDKTYLLNPRYDSGDGIHPNRELSALMATTILTEGFSIDCDLVSLILDKNFMRKYQLISNRNHLIHSYDKETIGHTSPWHDTYLPKEKLDKKVLEINKKIRKVFGISIKKEQLKWLKYKYELFVFHGYEAVIVFPGEADIDKNWLWRTEFFGAFTDADKIALNRGYHLVYINIIDGYGSDNALFTMKEFFDHIIKKYNLRHKCYMLGMSRGGLSAVNFAYKYTSLTLGLLLDAPVVDIRSWPKGDFSGNGSAIDYSKLKIAYRNDFNDPLSYGVELNNKLINLAKHKVPIAVISNESDDIVPYAENGALIKDAYKTVAGYYFEVIKPLKGHHPHGGTCTLDAFNFLMSKNM